MPTEENDTREGHGGDGGRHGEVLLEVLGPERHHPRVDDGLWHRGEVVHDPGHIAKDGRQLLPQRSLLPLLFLTPNDVIDTVFHRRGRT